MNPLSHTHTHACTCRTFLSSYKVIPKKVFKRIPFRSISFRQTFYRIYIYVTLHNFPINTFLIKITLTLTQVQKNKDLYLNFIYFHEILLLLKKHQIANWSRDTPAFGGVTLESPYTLASLSLRLPFPPRFTTAGIVDQLIRGGADRTAFHAGSCVISPMQLPGVPSVTPLHPRIYPNIRRL